MMHNYIKTGIYNNFKRKYQKVACSRKNKDIDRELYFSY